MSGYLLKQHQAALARGAGKCGFCPHLVLDHFELPRDHADYRPLLFACRADGCQCRITTGSVRGGSDFVPVAE